MRTRREHQRQKADPYIVTIYVHFRRHPRDAALNKLTLKNGLTIRRRDANACKNHESLCEGISFTSYESNLEHNLNKCIKRISNIKSV